jgi:hypothetical protein
MWFILIAAIFLYLSNCNPVLFVSLITDSVIEMHDSDGPGNIGVELRHGQRERPATTDRDSQMGGQAGLCGLPIACLSSRASVTACVLA